MRGSPILIGAGLLVLLTYLVIESRSPNQPARTRALGSLQVLQLQDAALNRAVLMARAGLLPHYDSIAGIRARISNELHALEQAGNVLAADGAPAIADQTRALAVALDGKHRLVDHYISDLAILRNSTTYFAQSIRDLGSGAGTGTLRAGALAASNAVLRFVQAPTSVTNEEADAAVALLGGDQLAKSSAADLAAHARIIVDYVPFVDRELRDLVMSPVPARIDVLQRTLLASAGAAEARAQRFRLMLYGTALTLVAYLTVVFARLRSRTLELRRKETQLIQANKMTALGTLVSSVAHEVNNPNQVVLTNLQLVTSAWHDMVERLDSWGGEREALTVAGLPFNEMREVMPRLLRDAEDSARRIERIVYDLKNFARPDTSVNEPFELNDVVGRALRLLAHVVRKRTDAFHVQLADTPLPVRGNPHQIEQVTINLVVNALEALPDRTASVTVATARDAGARQALLRVTDQGIGMTRQQLERLGEAFFTTKAATGGTGLGVAIAWSLVRLHKGSLAFTSQPGRGTRAVVVLPLDEGLPLFAGTREVKR
jgi:signal transduction histidine kinase